MNRFKNSIGPVWERPSQYLLWHYRTTNGLGFHEFLQLCEDLGAEPLYVCNCGLVCQGRSHENNWLEGDALKDMLEDALAALEYATAPADTRYGAMRAAAGHPEPFRMKYLEIGNENWGPLYHERYEYFRKEIKKHYPDMIIVSNTHVEKEGLPTDIVDEHFYSDVNFFAEQLHHYDHYDRKGPGVFVGELAVNVADTGNLRAALAEALFFIGMERNQDIVLIQFQRIPDRLQIRLNFTVFQLVQLIGHHDQRTACTLEPVAHGHIVCRRLMACIHDQYAQCDQAFLLKIALHQTAPADTLLLGDLSIAVTRKVNKIERVINPIIVYCLSIFYSFRFYHTFDQLVKVKDIFEKYSKG